jgi:hypothetical protein
VEIRDGIVKQNDQQLNRIIEDIKRKGEPLEDETKAKKSLTRRKTKL